ncbi:MAG: sodium pump decarboxylase subunit gamma [Caldanaerobacter subterraneus]|nr:sodium pump decarboxylase subunit gamma [Caldanaerobacter subterraneus]
MEGILKFFKKAFEEEKKQEIEEREEVKDELSDEVVAAIMAAISYYMDEGTTFYIRSIRETKEAVPLWSVVGRVEQMQARFLRRYC